MYVLLTSLHLILKFYAFHLYRLGSPLSCMYVCLLVVEKRRTHTRIEFLIIKKAIFILHSKNCGVFLYRLFNLTEKRRQILMCIPIRCCYFSVFPLREGKRLFIGLPHQNAFLMCKVGFNTL